MANIDMPILSVNLTGVSGAVQSVQLTPKDSTGTGIDLTGAAFSSSFWSSGDPAGSSGNSDISGVVSLLSASTGIAILAVTLPAPAGQYKGSLNVTPSGGTLQQLANISCNAQ